MKWIIARIHIVIMMNYLYIIFISLKFIIAENNVCMYVKTNRMIEVR